MASIDENTFEKKTSNKNKMQFLTVSFITAVSQIACWRLLQLVHIMSATVSHFDHDTPSAAVVAPVEADLSVDHSFLLLGMLTLQPPGCVRAATLGGDTGVRDLGTSISYELMPSSNCWQISLVAFKKASSQDARGTVSFAEFGVHNAFSRSCV